MKILNVLLKVLFLSVGVLAVLFLLKIGLAFAGPAGVDIPIPDTTYTVGSQSARQNAWRPDVLVIVFGNEDVEGLATVREVRGSFQRVYTDAEGRTFATPNLGTLVNPTVVVRDSLADTLAAVQVRQGVTVLEAISELMFRAGAEKLNLPDSVLVLTKPSAFVDSAKVRVIK